MKDTPDMRPELNHKPKKQINYMQQIRIRAWDGTKMIMPETIEGSGSGSMLYVMDFQGRCSLVNLFGLDMKAVVISPNLIPMLSTGQPDKDDKEIFVGDVLRRTITVPGLDPSVTTDVVVYERNGFFTKKVNDKSDEGSYMGDYYYHEIQVIGNIYENPELIPAVADETTT